jgi:CRP-like cAMP-binding protein
MALHTRDFVLSTSSSTEQTVSNQSSTRIGGASDRRNRQHHEGRANQESLERATYAYVQAIRALGRKEVTTVEIANALNLSVIEVEATLAALKKKGVKFA